MRPRFVSSLAALCLLTQMVSAVPAYAAPVADQREESFAEPIDGLSVSFTGSDVDGEVSALVDGRWSEWKALTLENEQDPLLLESNLVLFDGKSSRVRVRGTTGITVHPIRLGVMAGSTETAARAGDFGRTTILSRRDWDADESLRVTSDGTTDANVIGDNGDTSKTNAPQSGEQSTGRVSDCADIHSRYTDEFEMTGRRVTKDDQGRTLRWPQEYSPSVKLLTVHHTAISLAGDKRSGMERMQALYQYHSKNRGWGDIGYHYVIDDDGQIYEGRAGGDYVVGGHAYCNNVGTVGIALMGNFDVEKPLQKQMQSLQWLLDRLADRYGIDTAKSVTFHGKTLPAIVGHRNLLSTDCPGEYVFHTLDQVRAHVIAGDLDALITFPVLERAKPSQTPRSSATPGRATAVAEGLSATGDTTITGRPGGEVVIPLLFRAGSRSWKRGATIATIRRSQPEIGIWQQRGDEYVRVRSTLVLTEPLSKNETLLLRVKIQIPRDQGIHSVSFGPVVFSLVGEGRRARTPQTAPTRQTYVKPAAVIMPGRRPVQRTSASSSSPASSSQLTPSSGGPTIRIKLNEATKSGDVRLSLPSGTRMNGQGLAVTDVLLKQNGNECEAEAGSVDLHATVIRLDAGEDISQITSWNTKRNRFRGTLECRIVDGAMIIINELPLEDYMAGLAEEADTEPFEKQRAFAIAARSYARYYIESSQRKFPGKPYDGSDSPAEFQIYGGATFEEQNPRWVSAVRDTAGEVLTFNGNILKTPYFSSDEGRTLSPSEKGGIWTAFPESVFKSKPDPWCAGMTLRGHGIGMSGCGAEGQANEGKTAEEILEYYYPGTRIERK